MKKTAKYILLVAISTFVVIQLKAQDVTITTNATVAIGNLENLLKGNQQSITKLKNPSEDIWIQYSYKQPQLFNSYTFNTSNYKQFAPNWETIADRGYTTLNDLWWNSQGYYNSGYRDNGDPNTGFNYWWMAHALDILIDGYNRTGKPEYIAQAKKLNDGTYLKNGNTWLNYFYDDMDWMALAMLRLFEATNDYAYKNIAQVLWDDIQKGWTDDPDTGGGGIMWNKGTPKGKNACTNGPAMILALRFYALDKKESDKKFAFKIFDWMERCLVDPVTGAVWDGYSTSAIGDFNQVHTYNMGTWVGACLELWRLTGEQKYMDHAIKSTNFTLTDPVKLSKDGLLSSGGDGDGGLFGGIFMRYLSQLIMYGDLDKETKQMYVDYFEHNALSVWLKATTTGNPGEDSAIFGRSWWKPMDGLNKMNSSNQMSALMMFETLCELERKGFYNNEEHAPLSIKIKGSNDGVDWTLIAETKNISFFDNLENFKQEFNIKKFKHVRFEFPNSKNKEYSLSQLFLTENINIVAFPWDATDTKGGVLTASHLGEVGFGVENVIDNSRSKYTVNNVTGDIWIQYELPQPLAISGYLLLAADELKYAPKSWKMEASNNGTDWTKIDERLYEQFSKSYSAIIRELDWKQNDTYKFYRLTLTSINGGENLELADWQLVALASDYNGDPEYDFTSNGGTLTASNQGFHEGPYDERFPNTIDNKVGTKYCTTPGNTSFWLQYQSPVPMLLNGYSITSAYSDRSRDLKDWTIEGSNDGQNWDVLDTRTDQNFRIRYNRMEYECAASEKSYTYFRLNVTKNNGSDRNTQFVQLELFGTKAESNANLYGITINGEMWDINEPYLAECGANSLDVKVITVNEAIVDKGQTFIMDISSNNTSQSTTFTITSKDGSQTIAYTLNVNKKCDDADLKRLYINGVEWDISTPYTIECDSPVPTKLDIKVVAPKGATVDKGLEFVAEIGDQNVTDISFKITSGDASNIKGYTLNVKRICDDATLKGLKVEGTDWDVTKPIHVDFLTSELKIKITTANGASVDKGNLFTAPLSNSASQNIAFSITSKDGSKTTDYILVVTKTVDDATLHKLTIDGDVWDINDPYAVKSETKKIMLAITTAQGASVDKGNSFEIELSNEKVQKIIFTITSADGSKIQEYVLEITTTSDDASLYKLLINNTEWDINKPFVIASEDTQQHLNIDIETAPNATVNIGNSSSLDVDRPLIYNHKIVITSADGSTTQEYTLVIDKRLAFDKVVVQKWNNLLLVNNNSKTNGQYTFKAYQWFKNNSEVGSKQYYSAGDRKSDLLDVNAQYHVLMTTKEGEQVCTDDYTPVLESLGIKVYPNPVAVGEPITVELDVDADLLKNVAINAYSMQGYTAIKTTTNERITSLTLPSVGDVYIIQIMLNNGFKEEIKVLVK